MPDFALAQINVARFLLPKDDPANADFMAALDAVNARADAAPGFLWRLEDEGGNAVGIEAVAGDPKLIVNLSLWRDLGVLGAFVYGQADHVAVLRERRRWFEKRDPSMALWWVPAGRRPTVAEGLARLDRLAQEGPTPEAFTFRAVFAPPEVEAAAPRLETTPPTYARA